MAFGTAKWGGRTNNDFVHVLMLAQLFFMIISTSGNSTGVFPHRS